VSSARLICGVRPDNMSDDFTTLIGMFIHHCGSIEFLVNNSIRAFSTDEVLSAEAVSFALVKRIHLLKTLLTERSKLSIEEIKSLCKELDEIRIKRNMVAHNPIMMDAPNESSNSVILVLRYKSNDVETKNKLTKEDVSELVNKSKDLMLKIVQLIPESTNA